MRRGHDDGDAREASATRGGADAPATHDHRGPRFVTHSFPGSFEPHPYHPGRLDLERSIGEATGGALAALGHRVQWLPDLSIGTAGVCAISADLERGILYGGADPRRAARAMGW